MKKNLKINNLIVIKTIYETESISATATALGSNQTNISRMLTSLESDIGLKIFNRTTRTLSPTTFGQSFIKKVDDHLMTHASLNDLIDTYKRTPTGIVTIAASIGAINFITKKAMPTIVNKIPGISLSFISNNSIPHKNNTEKPHWDILISKRLPKDESLVARPILKVKTGFYASPLYLSRNSLSHPNELKKHQCIQHNMLGDSDDKWEYMDPETGSVTLAHASIKYYTEDVQSAIDIAKHGLGIIYAPQYTVMNDIAEGALIACFTENFHIKHQIYLIYKKRDYLPYRVQVVLDTMLDKHNVAYALSLIE